MKKIFFILFLLAITLTGVSQVSIKKSQDTCNQSLRKIITKLDSVTNNGKFKYVTFTITTTSTNTPYAVNNAIASTLTPNGFSVSLGAGNWHIENVIMTPPTALGSIAMNVAVFSSTVNSQTDHSAIDIYQGAVDQRYLGTIKLNTVWGMGTGTIYECQSIGTAGTLGRMPIYCDTPTIYLVPYATGIYTPGLNQQYIFKIALSRFN